MIPKQEFDDVLKNTQDTTDTTVNEPDSNAQPSNDEPFIEEIDFVEEINS